MRAMETIRPDAWAATARDGHTVAVIRHQAA
jgi:hypothetical protein